MQVPTVRNREQTRDHQDGSDVYQPASNITWVSRLQCVQAAVEDQIERIRKESPKRRIGLITFNNDVTIYGDGTQEPVVVTGEKLKSFEALKSIGVYLLTSKPLLSTEHEPVQVKPLLSPRMLKRQRMTF